MDNSYEQQALDLVKENEALKAENAALHCMNTSMRAAIDDEFDNGKPIDLVWLTRDELKGYSDLVQAGGLNSVKADAITEAANHAYAAGYKRPINFMHDYANKLRANNESNQS